MNKFVDQQEHGLNKKANGFFLFLYRLVSFFQWTEEEQKAAGIYLGSLYDKDDDK